MSNYSNFLNNSQSQPDGVDRSQDMTVPNREMYRLVLLTQCSERDLITACHIGISGNAEVSHIMPIVDLSNPATNVYLRKLSGDPKVGGMKIPILRRDKGGSYGSYLHYLNYGLTLEDIQSVMAERGISYEKHIIDNLQKKVDDNPNATSDTVTEEQLAKDLHQDKADTLDAPQSDEPLLYCNSDQASEEEQKLYNGEFKELNQDSPSCYTQNIQQVNTQTDVVNPNANPPKFVPVYEVIKIVDKVADVLVQQFNNKIAELEARITEQNTRIVGLEGQLASLQDYQPTNNDCITEEYLQNLSNNITSKIVGFSSKQNGKSPH